MHTSRLRSGGGGTKSKRRIAGLAGSRPPQPSGATTRAAGAADAPLELTLRLRGAAGGLERFLAAVHAGRQAPLSRAEFAARFGARAGDRRILEDWARRERLELFDWHRSRRSVEVRGSARKLARLFGIDLVDVRDDGRSWRSHTRNVTVPAALAGVVTGVLGFHQRPLAGRGMLPRMRGNQAKDPKANGVRTAKSACASGPSFTAPEIAALYDFPTGLDGHGQTIGVVALGGGYRRRDLQTYFRELQLPHPRFTDVSVHGAKNAPDGRTSQFDGEVTSDIETVGGLVPAAHIVVYFAHNTERGFLGAVASAVHDDRRRPQVISVSWGRNERHWTRSTLRQFDRILAEAAAMGITVCCSSGDDGAHAEVGDRAPGVCFPASSPHVLACGGTSLLGTTPRRIRERGWRDDKGASGGGESKLLRRPSWQVAPTTPGKTTARPGRCLPDVAANADPDSGYRVYVAGAWHVGAGTSASAPVWAGLIARINQLLGRPLGLITPVLFGRAQALVRSGAVRPVRIIEGGKRLQRKGWNKHTGLGVPQGRKLAKALEAAVRAPRARGRA